jgi:DNA-binding response OmpR family regulator
MRSAGFSAETFSRGADFLSSPDLSRTACLVTDLNMPGMTGFDLHRRLQSLGRSIPTVLITAQPNENVRTQALSLGIICYLPKPFRGDDLIDSIHFALRSRQASGAAVSSRFEARSRHRSVGGPELETRRRGHQACGRVTMTIGIVVVACCAGTASGDAATMTSTFSRTSSVARSVSRSYWPSAERHSTTKSFPST